MDPTPNSRVSVILPVYRLGDVVGANIHRTVAALSPLADFEVVVVDDGSDDGTLAAAEAAAREHGSVLVVGHASNRGKGQTIRTGYEASTGSIVVFLDGDLDLPPEQLPQILDTFESSGVDALVGSKRRSMAAGGYRLWRRAVSRIFSSLTRLAFRLPVSETQTGLKVFRREVLDRLVPLMTVTRYAYDIELLVLAHRHGYRIGEVPVDLQVIGTGTQVRFRTLWEVGRDTAGIWVRSFRRPPQ